jgi:hypothetical protein
MNTYLDQFIQTVEEEAAGERARSNEQEGLPRIGQSAPGMVSSALCSASWFSNICAVTEQ